jgi:hypothetical protein
MKKQIGLPWFYIGSVLTKEVRNANSYTHGMRDLI